MRRRWLNGRHSTRLVDHDYTSAATYFVTTCTYERLCWFGDVFNDRCVLSRAGDTLFLSSHTGDSKVGQAIVVMTEDVDALFTKFTHRGLVPPKRDSPVHHGPIDQDWGTREFYVDDPDGNTLRFTQGPSC